jgi:adenylosuccinate synthase
VAPLAIQVVDLGFGDAGKGAMVDYLVRRHDASLVVRFNGGPQAGHNVVLPDGRHHTFAQFGSGTFVPGLRTLLSRFVLVEPYAMLNEARHLESLGVRDAMGRTSIDERCLVITPPQQVANRIRERARGAAAYGTCGLGVGECVADDLARPELSLFAAQLRDRAAVKRKLATVLEFKRTEFAEFVRHATPDERRVLDDPAWIETAVETYASIARSANIVAPQAAERMIYGASNVVFEGAQGVLLDERFGFHPHTTWSTTTFANADTLLTESRSPAIHQRIGVTRTYMTRHGPGPFPTHRPALSETLPEPHNADDGRQGVFRRGLLDFVLLRYAIQVCGGDLSLAVTHVDKLPALPAEACDAYLIDGSKMERLPYRPQPTLKEMNHLGEQIMKAQILSTPMPSSPATYLATVAEKLAVPVDYFSIGPTHAGKRRFTSSPAPSH